MKGNAYNDRLVAAHATPDPTTDTPFDRSGAPAAPELSSVRTSQPGRRRGWIGAIGRLRFRRPLADYGLLAEAVYSLSTGWLRLHTRPFKALTTWLSRPSTVPAPSEPERAESVRRVSWAIRWLAERGPLPFVCFPQAIAASAMLRRRGVPVVLYYGVRLNAVKALEAHVWVKDGEVPIVGCRTAEEFKLLHVFAPDGARVSESGR